MARYAEMMEWIPIIFFIFKILVFGTGMFFAIKWHYDKGKKEKEKKEKEKKEKEKKEAKRNNETREP